MTALSIATIVCFVGHTVRRVDKSEATTPCLLHSATPTAVPHARLLQGSSMAGPQRDYIRPSTVGRLANASCLPIPTSRYDARRGVVACRATRLVVCAMHMARWIGSCVIVNYHACASTLVGVSVFGRRMRLLCRCSEKACHGGVQHVPANDGLHILNIPGCTLSLYLHTHLQSSCGALQGPWSSRNPELSIFLSPLPFALHMIAKQPRDELGICPPTRQQGLATPIPTHSPLLSSVPTAHATEQAAAAALHSCAKLCKHWLKKRFPPSILTEYRRTNR